MDEFGDFTMEVGGNRVAEGPPAVFIKRADELVLISPAVVKELSEEANRHPAVDLTYHKGRLVLSVDAINLRVQYKLGLRRPDGYVAERIYYEEKEAPLLW